MYIRNKLVKLSIECNTVDIHTYIHPCMHACIHTYIHTYVRTYIRTYVHTYIRTYVHTYIRTYVHTYIRTYLPTYVHHKMQRGQSDPVRCELPRTSMKVLKAHACHANRAGGAESVTPATQKAAAPNQSQFVAKLPRTSIEIPKVPRLPRKSRLRC